ncbi:MAG: hypothetical protein IPJ34_32435 [Myxococcales bacterium]|nr:hypothetical protein [Myxococcales bacterium]
MHKPFALVVASLLVACSAGKDDPQTNPALDGSLDGDATTLDVSGLDADGATDDAGPIIPDPTTCAQAAASHTYVGCDFWPTVTDNIVRPDFDYAVVVANFGDVDADVEVTRGPRRPRRRPVGSCRSTCRGSPSSRARRASSRGARPT